MLHVTHLRDGFDAYRLNPDNVEGWPWQPFLHRISRPDTAAHDHPGNLTSTIVRGDGYVEEVLEWRSGRLVTVDRIRRRLGDRFEVLGETIHRIVEIIGPETWSFVEHEPSRRPWAVYSVDEPPIDMHRVGHHAIPPGYKTCAR